MPRARARALGEEALLQVPSRPRRADQVAQEHSKLHAGGAGVLAASLTESAVGVTVTDQGGVQSLIT